MNFAYVDIVSIQCADPQCHVWQHIRCVIIPEESTEGAPPASPQLYCEVCRIDRCDPYVLSGPPIYLNCVMLFFPVFMSWLPITQFVKPKH